MPGAESQVQLLQSLNTALQSVVPSSGVALEKLNELVGTIADFVPGFSLADLRLGTDSMSSIPTKRSN